MAKDRTACPPAPAPRIVTAIATIAVAAAAHAQQQCYPWHGKIVNGSIALGEGAGATQVDAGNAAIAAFDAWASAPQSSGLCAGTPGGWAQNLQIIDASRGTVELWTNQAYRINGVDQCVARLHDTDYVEFWQTYCPPAPPPPPPAPPPPLPPMPPLGCASGEGGFTECFVDTGVPPSSPNPPGTPTEGGPGPNIGDPGADPPPVPPETVNSDDTADDPGSDTSNTCKNAAAVGDPVFAATGNVYQEEVDYRGPMGLNVVRRYNSALPGWVHNFSLRVLANATAARVVRADGRSHLFAGSGAGEWTSEAATSERLIRLDPSDASQPAWQYLTAQDGAEWYDAQGRLMALTRRGGLTYTAQQSAGLLRSVSDAFGHSIQFAYDARNRLAQITTPEGSTIAYGYDAQGRLASVTYPDGTTRQYLYENASYPLALTGITDERGMHVVSWSYDANGRAAASDRAGAQRYQYQYNADGTATYTDPLGTTRTQVYAQAGPRKVFAGQSQPCANCVGDAASNLVDPATGLVTQSSDFLGISTLFTIDAQRKLPISATRAAGRPEAQTVQVQWHPTLRVPALVWQPGRSTAYSYDALGNVLSKTVTDTATGQARTWQWSYNAQNLVQTFTDPRGSTWRYGYDAGGNRTSAIDPLGRQTHFAYDAAGRVTSQTDPGGLVWTYAYDLRGRLTSQSRGGETSTYAYTPNGQIASATLPNGYQVGYAYDAAQRLIAANDNRGASIQYTLDGMGNRVAEQVKDANGNIALTTTRVIDSLNRVAAMQGANGQSTRFGYDANGQLVATTDPLNQSTQQSLDALGRTTVTTFADNTSVAQSWNALDALTQVTDPKGVKTQYQANAFGEVMSETSPDIGSIAYQRDGAGNVIATTDARGNTANITRDALGRITQIAYSDQVQVFAYDAQGNIGRIDDGSGSTVYTRDALGRVLTKTQTVNDVPSSPSKYVVQFGYTQGDLTSIRYPSGLQVRYQRTAGRITQVDVQQPAKAPLRLVADLSYTALGQPRSWNWFNGDSASRSFDADGRMTANEFARYGFDVAGRITSITQMLWAAPGETRTRGGRRHHHGAAEPEEIPITWAINYDSRNRLSGMSREGQSTTFTYDANSNRLSKLEIATSDVDLEGQFDSPGVSLTTSETPKIDSGSNRLLGFSVFTTAGSGRQSSTNTAQVQYAVDASGNMTSDGQRTFVYDASNRLVKVEAANKGDIVGVEYMHNALGQRVFKSDPVGEQHGSPGERFGNGFLDWLRTNFGWVFDKSSKSRLGLVFVYDEQGNLIASYSDGSSNAAAQQMEVIWLPLEDGSSIPVGVYKDGQFYAVHTDHLGTPRLITDNTNAPAWQWPYGAFGNNKPAGVLSTSATTSVAGQTARFKWTQPALEFSLRFPGQFRDSESNLAYNYFRNYLPEQGRYVQPDRSGLEGGPSRFTYVGGNPLSYTDPRGLQPYTGQTPPPDIPGGPWTPAGPGQKPGTFFGPKKATGPKDICRYVPDAANGGPDNVPRPYWKTQTPGELWQRFDTNGNPIAPEEAHPGNPPRAPIPFSVPGSFPIPPLFCPLCNILMPQPAPNGPV